MKQDVVAEEDTPRSDKLLRQIIQIQIIQIL